MEDSKESRLRAEFEARFGYDGKALSLTGETIKGIRWETWLAATSKSQERIRELEEALRGMLSSWDAICNVKGWDKDHLYAAVEARAALKEPK